MSAGEPSKPPSPTAALVAIGVIAALLVNYFLPRERVTAAWDGLLHRLGR